GGLVPNFKELAGDAALGVRLAVDDTSPEALGKAYPVFLRKYKARYGGNPVGGFHHFAYDAAMLGFDAVKRVAKKDAKGNTHIGRKALRDAIVSTKGLHGLTGTKTCGASGDCGRQNLTILRYVSASAPFELGANPRKVFPAAN
ncbi:MAG: branched-chain amino acid ABC transporter substrate-binding protein, partial [Alphaproteobacteria bacterium]